MIHMERYRGFTITIHAAADGYVFRINGGGLPRTIEDTALEQSVDRSICEAKEFIDEHLVRE